MSTTNTRKAASITRLLPLTAAALVCAAAAHGATPGITGSPAAGSATAATFNLTASAAYINQPDGNQVYSWGYGCTTPPVAGAFVPATAEMAAAVATAGAGACSTMQIPGPTLIVTEGATVTVTLTNALPTSAGNTSILFPGFTLTSVCPAAQQGLLTCEALPGGTVTYTFVARTPGTRAYYSGTQGDLQVEMGLSGAIVVLPAAVPAACTTGLHAQNVTAETSHGEHDFRLSQAAYDHPGTCYDREYLFQFAEMDLNIHRTALAQVNDPKRVTACGPSNARTPNAPGCPLEVPTEPYHPVYYLVNGRSMPDLMDPNYDAPYPHQPYNGNPHMHPGEVTLIRVIGQGRWEHPFHEHANHVRILARDGNPIIANSQLPYNGTSPGANTTTPVSAQTLAGLLMFTTDTFPGQAFDGLFYFTGKGLNWDLFAHNPTSTDPSALLTCTPDANGYNTGASASGAINYFEWCQDHNKPLETHPFGDVNGGGPMTLPNPNIFANGAWYGGSPYLGPDATVRADASLPSGSSNGGGPSGCLGGGVVAAGTPTQAAVPCTNLQPSNVQANPPNERGIAFMWHSHNEREITTQNVFPGGMLMMMLVDSREFAIDESK